MDDSSLNSITVNLQSVDIYACKLIYQLEGPSRRRMPPTAYGTHTNPSHPPLTLSKPLLPSPLPRPTSLHNPNHPPNNPLQPHPPSPLDPNPPSIPRNTSPQQQPHLPRQIQTSPPATLPPNPHPLSPRAPDIHRNNQHTSAITNSSRNAR